jgi:hypothetical protein
MKERVPENIQVHCRPGANNTTEFSKPKLFGLLNATVDRKIMENAIEKKIWEYQGKIEAHAELQSIKNDEIRIEAQRQAYVQAKHDFDSLLDSLVVSKFECKDKSDE